MRAAWVLCAALLAAAAGPAGAGSRPARRARRARADTIDAAGRATIGRLLVALRALLPGVTVRMAYAGVARPGLADVLRALPGPVVVVPAFLASGFHVRVDVPGQLAETGRTDVVLADPRLVEAANLVTEMTEVKHPFHEGQKGQRGIEW